MILNNIPVCISNSEEFKKTKRSGDDCGNEWVSIPKFYGKWVGTGWRKVKKEYQEQLCLCEKKKRHYCRFNKDLHYCYI